MDLNVGIDLGHTVQSSTREKVLEHLFIGELLRCLWCKGSRDTEVLRAEVDKGGYDLVLEANGVMRHVQLKSSRRDAKTRDVMVNTALASKPSGCVVWVRFDAESLKLGPFLWFGGSPGARLPPLGDRIGKHTKGDGHGRKNVRPRIRVLKRSQLIILPTMDAVARQLFGL